MNLTPKSILPSSLGRMLDYRRERLWPEAGIDTSRNLHLSSNKIITLANGLLCSNNYFHCVVDGITVCKFLNQLKN